MVVSPRRLLNPNGSKQPERRTRVRIPSFPPHELKLVFDSLHSRMSVEDYRRFDFLAQYPCGGRGIAFTSQRFAMALSDTPKSLASL